MDLSKAAEDVRKQYRKEWREKNRKKLAEYQRKWFSEHKEERAEYERKYWEKKARELAEQNSDTEP